MVREVGVILLLKEDLEQRNAGKGKEMDFILELLEGNVPCWPRLDFWTPEL